MKRGFSLVEIAFVLVIIAILLTLLAPELTKILGDSKRAQAFSQGKDIKKILLEYQYDPLKKRSPADRGKFQNSGSDITFHDLVKDKYMKGIPIDPWHQPWQIIRDTSGEVYVVSPENLSEGRHALTIEVGTEEYSFQPYRSNNSNIDHQYTGICKYSILSFCTHRWKKI